MPTPKRLRQPTKLILEVLALAIIAWAGVWVALKLISITTPSGLFDISAAHDSALVIGAIAASVVGLINAGLLFFTLREQRETNISFSKDRDLRLILDLYRELKDDNAILHEGEGPQTVGRSEAFAGFLRTAEAHARRYQASAKLGQFPIMGSLQNLMVSCRALVRKVQDSSLEEEDKEVYLNKVLDLWDRYLSAPVDRLIVIAKGTDKEDWSGLMESIQTDLRAAAKKISHASSQVIGSGANGQLPADVTTPIVPKV
jgi:hypothetical protein